MRIHVCKEENRLGISFYFGKYHDVSAFDADFAVITFYATSTFTKIERKSHRRKQKEINILDTR